MRVGSVFSVFSFPIYLEFSCVYDYLPRICSFPGGASSKEPTCPGRSYKSFRFDSWVRKIPWRRAWQPTPVFLPGEAHGQRSLEGHSPSGHKESDMTEETSHTQHPALG